MDFIYNNLTFTDCTLVAIYNALLVVGKPISYDIIRETSITKGWYIEGVGFKTDLLPKCLKFFKLRFRNQGQVLNMEKLKSQVKSGKSFILLTSPLFAWFPAGHTMIATKGNKGIRVFNGIEYNTGWKTLYKELKQKSEIKLHAIEICGAA